MLVHAALPVQQQDVHADAHAAGNCLGNQTMEVRATLAGISIFFERIRKTVNSFINQG
jgi:hypothetical protein